MNYHQFLSPSLYSCITTQTLWSRNKGAIKEVTDSYTRAVWKTANCVEFIACEKVYVNKELMGRLITLNLIAGLNWWQIDSIASKHDIPEAVVKQCM